MLRRSTWPALPGPLSCGTAAAALSMCQRSTRKPSREALDRRSACDLRGVLLRAAQRLRMHEREVREIAQVVDDQQVVRVVVQVVGLAAPARVAQVREIDDLRRVGLGRIAHPDPDQVVALDDRVAAHAELGGNVVLPGDLHALAVGSNLRPWYMQRTPSPSTRSLGEAARRGGSSGRRAPPACRSRPCRSTTGLPRIVRAASFPVDELVVPGRDVPAVGEKNVVVGPSPWSMLLARRPAWVLQPGTSSTIRAADDARSGDCDSLEPSALARHHR